MPSWKPDCLKASATLNQISNTIQSARLLQGILFVKIKFYVILKKELLQIILKIT